MKKTSMIRPAMRPLVFVALLIAVASAGLSLRGDGLLRNTVSAQSTVKVVSAASFATDSILTPDSIAAAFGTFVTQNNQQFFAQPGQPLPTTLGGVRVQVGATDARLFFASPLQINLQIPPGLADNPTTPITVTNSDSSTRTGTLAIVRSSPGVFTLNSSGTGVAVAITTSDGVAFQNIFNPDGTERDVDAGTRARPNILVLFATGLRTAPATNPNDANGVAESVTVRFQGVPVTPIFAGAVPGLVGLDQINVAIPPELAGIGRINVVVNVSGRAANAVTMKLGGQAPPVNPTPIMFGQTLNGELTPDDQVQIDDSTRNTFFFDAYRFQTTAANTTIAVDLRSSQFDAAVLLYRVVNNTLMQIAADDQTGGYGSAVANNNALLLTVLPTPGDYVIFASSADIDPNGLGQYSVKLLNNVITQINYAQTTSGAAITNTDLQTSGGAFLDVYWFNGSQGDKQQIRMSSTAIDSFLILQRDIGDPPLTADDNSGDDAQNRDALIDPTHGDVEDFPPIPSLPQTGVYIIIATPFTPNLTGAYTLSLNKLASFGAEAEAESDYKVPGRQIRDHRGRAAEFEGTTLERLGRRRIIQ